jgi:hypothetical protein
MNDELKGSVLCQKITLHSCSHIWLGSDMSDISDILGSPSGSSFVIQNTCQIFMTTVRHVRSVCERSGLTSIQCLRTLQIMYMSQYNAQSFMYIFVTFIPTEFENVTQNPWPYCVVLLQNIRRIYILNQNERLKLSNIAMS